MVNTEIRLTMFFTTKGGESLSGEASKIGPRADCGSHHELLIEKFRLKLKKVWETTGPFRYDLNQIPFDYTVEVKNRFKEFDLVERVPEELWKDIHNIIQESVTKAIPKKKKFKKGEWVSEETLQIAEVKREAKAREKGKYTPN